ncbi:MAG: class I SAM-dependent methyltransferase [Gemmatimonadaceae bacterium]
MLIPRRVHAFELLDFASCPHAIRDGATAYLQFIIRTGNAYAPVIPALATALNACGQLRVVDLCSGGGGPWPEMRAALVRAGATPELDVTLTDLFPNHDAFATISTRDSQVHFQIEPIDVERDVVQLRGMRTLFSSFHHFRPAQAERLLRRLAVCGDEIFIAEVTQRSVRAILFMLLAPIFVWLATPFIRPFRWSRLALTYLVPIIPFVVSFDGIMSCLRSYTTQELRELVSTLSDLDYDWTIAEARGNAPMPVTYVVGVPRVRRS